MKITFKQPTAVQVMAPDGVLQVNNSGSHLEYRVDFEDPTIPIKLAGVWIRRERIPAVIALLQGALDDTADAG